MELSSQEAELKLTEAEKELVLRERERLALESRNWPDEPYVTDLQLHKMSAHFREVFLRLPLLWRRDDYVMIYRNASHPDNESWCNAQDAADVVKRYYESQRQCDQEQP